MSKKTVRFEPYYLEDPEDERIPMSVASYAALLKPGFVLDMTQPTESQERSTTYIKVSDSRVGQDQGLDITHRLPRPCPGGHREAEQVEQGLS